MTGYRDTYADGAHTVVLDKVELKFGADGVLWDPSEALRAVLERDGTRAARFPKFTDEQPLGEVVTGKAMVDALVEQQQSEEAGVVAPVEVGTGAAAAPEAAPSRGEAAAAEPAADSEAPAGERRRRGRKDGE